MPAPGSYDLKSKAFDFDKPKSSYIGKKLDFDDTKKFIHSLPGPGAHDPAFKMTKTMQARYSMGTKLSTPRNTTAIVPGPGTYVNDSQRVRQQTAPSFGFGTSKRPAIGYKKDTVPGPGSYKLPAKIADTAPYSMPGKNVESKYV